MSGFGDFICWCMMILWHVYFGDVWLISAVTVDGLYTCMLFDIFWWRDVYFLNKCFIHVYYRFNRNRVLYLLWYQLKFWRASFLMFYMMFQHQTQTKCWVRCFNIELAENKQIKENIKDININGTVDLLTQFGYKHTYSGGYQAKKEIH